MLEARNATAASRLAAVRCIQLALGDLTASTAKGTVLEGYTARAPLIDVKLPKCRARFLADWPELERELRRELARTLAMVEDDDPATLQRILERSNEDFSSPRRTSSTWQSCPVSAHRSSEGITQKTAQALLALDQKLDAKQGAHDRHWPLRIAELHAELAKKDELLNAALINDPQFGRPDHVVFTHAQGFDRARAAKVFLAKAAKDEAYPWTPAHVELLGTVTDKDLRPVLRGLWPQAGLRNALLPLLARAPVPEDRAYFIESLASPQLATIRLSLDTLAGLPAADDGQAALALIRCLRSLPDGKEENQLSGAHRRGAAASDDGRFRQGQGTLDDLVQSEVPPARPAPGRPGRPGRHRRRGRGRVDQTPEPDRLVHRPGGAGAHRVSENRLHRVPLRRPGAFGPDLRGVASRFSRADLFTAILQPSRDVSPRYQTTLLATADGKLYQGSIIYEAVDSLILQTGPVTTVRIPGNQITTRRSMPKSLMPAGLLDQATDQEIADLWGYLETMRGK